MTVGSKDSFSKRVDANFAIHRRHHRHHRKNP